MPKLPVCPLMHEYDHDSGWEAVTIDYNGVPLYIHIVPCADMRRHQLDPSCWCSPSMDEDDKSVVVHHSADGRETYERGRKMQ